MWRVVDRGKEGRTFDCEGVFCGSGCYLLGKSLAQIFNAGQAVTFVHAQWGNATVLLTQLEIDETCKTDFLRYRFRLVEMPTS